MPVPRSVWPRLWRSRRSLSLPMTPSGWAKTGRPISPSSILPRCAPFKACVSVEQSAKFGWEKYVGLDGCSIGMTTFGASAPLQELQKKFGFTVDQIVAAAKDQIAKHK